VGARALPRAVTVVLCLGAGGCAAGAGGSGADGSTDGSVGADASAGNDRPGEDTARFDAGVSRDGPSEPRADAPPGASSDGAVVDSSGSKFVPSNIPPATPLTAVGDWVFDATTCGTPDPTGPEPEIDGSLGAQNCAPGAATSMTTAQVGGGEIAIFIVNRLTIADGTRVRLVGHTPIAIVALGEVEIAGEILANGIGTAAFAGGGGGNSAGPGGGGNSTATASAGGAGYCGRGGLGGGTPGGASGASYGNPTITPLVGGSSGGGGDTLHGEGGGGGSALQIVSLKSIHIAATGIIQAGGQGGIYYGSGGGSGGSILLEAPSITVDGTLASNGGAGAGTGLDDGQNGQPSASTAFSDLGHLEGNPGGNGAANVNVDGKPAPVPASGVGGGGGGAVGRIRLNTASGAATIGATGVISPGLATACATQGTLHQ
jgi:hypothetical protein